MIIRRSNYIGSMTLETKADLISDEPRVIIARMAVERREKDVSGGGGGKERNLSLVDVYDIAADIGKVGGEQEGYKLWDFL